MGCTLVLCVEVDGHDKPVETQYFREDENQDHTDKETRLLRGSTNSRVAHDTDSEPCCESTETHGQPGPQVQETPATNTQVK